MMRTSMIFLVAALFLAAHPVLAATVTVSWNPNSEPDVASYKVYFGPTPRAQGAYTNSTVVQGRTNTTVQLSLNPGTYYFAVTATDNSSNESAFSSEVSATVPSIQPPGKPGKPILVP